MPVISDKTLAEIGRVTASREPAVTPPDCPVTLIASAFCSACTWRTYRQDEAHALAQQHRTGVRHTVVVVETVTTTYEGEQ